MKLFFTISIITIALNADMALPNNFETDFNQTITNDKGKVIKYYGNVKFKQEKTILVNESGLEREISSKLFKWSYKSPTQKEVCTDGVQLLVIDHDLEQISNYLIDESLDLEEVLKVAQKISTKDYKAIYKEVEYLISVDKAGKLKKIFYTDTLDNRVRIIFENMKYDIKSFDDRGLECEEPTDYDKIEG
ncbi:Outer membrane lipoprotein carrier protein LolA [hydrothermal vent metagenome]|uniref:Outer membrane lipoprotein carrier protein LolA n=1 Tax=hydrothermal vent metagenome TaxID=652676 RepID=A0A1W1C7F3_9ZZZZ